MNHAQPGPTKAVVFAYFARQATPLERQAIEAWLTTDEGTVLYYTYLDEWERQHPQFYPDADAARHRFAQFIRSPLQTEPANTGWSAAPVSSAPSEMPRRWLGSRWMMCLAASIGLIMSLWLTSDRWYYTTQANGYK